MQNGLADFVASCASVLERCYGIGGAACEAVPGGWSALAVKAVAPGGVFFLKVYDKRRAATARYTAHLESYLGFVARLAASTPLRGALPRPLRALSGRFGAEDADHVYALFEFVEGRTVGDAPLTDAEARQLGRLLALLHLQGTRLLPEGCPREDFGLPYADRLPALVGEALRASGAEEYPARFADLLTRFMERAGERATAFGNADLPLVACHTDMHGHNLMRTKAGLVLLDWEGLRAAPAEADLFMLPGWPRDTRILRAYQECRPGFQTLCPLMWWYADRRILEDMGELAEQLLNDRQEAQERQKTAALLLAECDKVRAFMLR